MVWVPVVLGVLVVGAGVFVWSVRQVGVAIENAYKVGSEAAVRATFGIVPQSEAPAGGEPGLVSRDDIFEEETVGPEEAQRLLARLTPWDGEEGNSFE